MFSVIIVWIPSSPNFRPLVLFQSNLYPLPRGEGVREHKSLEEPFACIVGNPSCGDVDAPGLWLLQEILVLALESVLQVNNEALMFIGSMCCFFAICLGVLCFSGICWPPSS